MATQLSAKQQECVDAALEHGGVLVKYSGGFWSCRNAEMKTIMHFQAPDWSYGTQTIRALIKKGVFRVTKEKTWEGGSYPVQVEVTSDWISG